MFLRWSEIVLLTELKSKSWIAKTIKLQVFKCGEEDKGTFFGRITQIIEQEYENVSKADSLVEVSARGALCQFRMEDRDGVFILKSTIKYDHNHELKTIIDTDLPFFDLSNSIPSSMPWSILSTFIIFVSMPADETLAVDIVERLSDLLSRPRLGIGMVRGCLMSILESESGERELFNKNYIVSPLRLQGATAEKMVESIIVDVENISIYTARLSRLYGSNRSFFTALKPGVTEIGEKTEGFLWKLTGPDPVELGTLESWLAYIMERGATISTMILTMQSNLIEANSIISEVDDIFNRLSEERFEEYPKNLNSEIKTYNRIVRQFKDFIIVSEALKSRLETVMEEVRTYLSLQQQKISLEEQKASKDQLIRLVNLQEILHKLEILIIAVYINEMARTIFEALFHESANLLTAIFIPFSLIISVLLIYMLHKSPLTKL